MSEHSTAPMRDPEPPQRQHLEQTSHSETIEAGPSRPKTSYGVYLNCLNNHIDESRQALSGIGGTNPNSEFKYATTVVPPLNTTWTPMDKAALFASIRRHSRFRPDLIAMDLNKTEGEVEEYLSMLQDATEAIRRSDGALRGFRDRSARRLTSRIWPGGVAPSARQVSNDWIKEEERLSDWVTRAALERGKEARRVKSSEEKEQFVDRAVKEHGVRKDRNAGQKVKEDATKEFEKLLRLEVWGDHLDGEKLDLLDRLLLPSYREDGNGGLTQTQTPRSTPEPAVTEEEPEKLNKADKILRDEERIEELSSIDRATRTVEQRAELSVLVNRKRNRERIRMKILLAQGYTEEQVVAQGGPDAVFSRQTAKMERVRKKRMDKDEHGVDGLREMGVEALAIEHGWEVIHFGRMRQLMEDGFDDRAAVTFEFLDELKAELMEFLNPLILLSILIAEQDEAQLEHQQSGGQHAITREHVDTALAALGGDFGGRHRYLNRLLQVGQDTETQECRRRRDVSQPPGVLSWNDIALDVHHPPHNPDDEDDVQSDGEMTEKEDEELDQYLDNTDRAIDALVEVQLWSDIDADLSHVPKKRCKISEDPNSTRLLEEAREAQSVFDKRSAEIMRERRWRRSVQARTILFPLTRLKKEAASMRLGKSRSTIVDSDDEEEDLDAVQLTHESEEEGGHWDSDESEAGWAEAEMIGDDHQDN